MEAGEVGGMAKQEEISLISDSGDVVRTRECSFCGATTIAMAATSGECDKRRLLPCVKKSVANQGVSAMWRWARRAVCIFLYFLVFFFLKGEGMHTNTCTHPYIFL